MCVITEAVLQADAVLKEGGRDDIVSLRPLHHGPTRHTESTPASRTVERLPDGHLNGSPSVEREEGKEGVDFNLPTDQYDPCLSLAGFMEGLLLKEIHWPLSAYFPPETEHCNHSVSFRSGSLAKTLSFLLSRYDLLLTSPCQQFEFSALVLLPSQKRQFSSFLHPADITFMTFHPLGSSFSFSNVCNFKERFP